MSSSINSCTKRKRKKKSQDMFEEDGIVEASMKAGTAKDQQETQQYKVFPILFAMLLSGFIGLFGETALNVALTPLMGLLEVGPTTIQWLTTGYLLVLGI